MMQFCRPVAFDLLTCNIHLSSFLPPDQVSNDQECDTSSVVKNDSTLDISTEAERVLRGKKIHSSFLSQEADRVLEKEVVKSTQTFDKISTPRAQNEQSLDLSREANDILRYKDIAVSMATLMENAAQEATWSRQGIKNPAKNGSPNQMLPPIHPDRLTVTIKDDNLTNQGRIAHQSRSTNVVIPSITEYSPTRSDHSADAAAGAKQLKNLIFGPLEDGEEKKKLDPVPMRRVSKSFPTRGEMDNESCMSIDSWEVDIIGGNSPVVSVVKGPTDVEPVENLVDDPTVNTLKLSEHLEMKLEMLRKNAGVSDPLSIGDDKSTMSGRVSVVSIQPSVESECVRQNADIALLMEDTMMDFMVIDGEEELSIYSDVGGEDASLQRVPSQGSGILSNPSSHQASLQRVSSQESTVLSNPSDSEPHNEPQPILNPQFAQLQYVAPPAPALKPVLSKALSRHQFFSKRHFPSLLSVDEEEEFSEPNFRASPKSSNESSPKSTTRGKGLRVITKHKDLGKFLDQFRDNLMTGCAPLKDEDLESSFVFSQEFLANGDDDEMDEHSVRGNSLPFSKGMSAEERALKR
jgi:hypothetical protein